MDNRYFESELQGCYFSDCKFFNCSIMSISTEDTEVKFCEFTDCILIGINWNTLMPNGRFADPIQRLTNCKLRLIKALG